MMRPLVCALVLIVCSACSQDARDSANLVAPSPTGLSRVTVSSVSVPSNYRAHLSGDQVVPPRDTLAQGEAVLQLSPDGTELSYRVIASNITNVTGAHIHLAAAGSLGPLTAFLLAPVPPAGGRTDGVLAEGTLTAANLFGPLAGQPLSALIGAIEAGNAYVDIPTSDGVPPPATGPGDFPAGELRGQLR
jgi:CHRD domain-containing protein